MSIAKPLIRFITVSLGNGQFCTRPFGDQTKNKGSRPWHLEKDFLLFLLLPIFIYSKSRKQELEKPTASSLVLGLLTLFWGLKQVKSESSFL